MKELENKYIDLLLKKCLNVNISKSLFINYDKINKEFVNKVIEKAKKIGFQDIYLDEDDVFFLHDKLKKTSLEEIKDDTYHNKKIWDVYAKKGSNFLILDTEFPGVMDDIEQEKISLAKSINRKTRKLFRKLETNYQIPWCIAAIPNEVWAKNIFPDSNNANEKLFKVICEMCMVDTDNPIKNWNDFISDSKKQVDWLNSLKIKSLHYTNILGTDLKIYMPENYKWNGACDELEKEMFVNMPSYEIFTSPNYKKTEGIVYSSKPLYYGGGLIDSFFIEFKNGKVVNFGAEKGYNLLKEIIESDKNSCYLGEVALVNYDSPISNTGLVFGTTLFDENASCHLALGDGFPNAIKDGINMSGEELLENGINVSDNHVDFMIGTSDLTIEADTENGKKIIFKNGNFINH